MKRLLSIALLIGFTVTTAYAQDQQTATTIDDYIQVNELGKISKIRTRNNDNTTFLNTGYAIYHSGKKNTLIKFRRECQALTKDEVRLPDTRTNKDYLFASSDTLRGCRIDSMYPLEEHQVAEVKALAGK